MGVLDRVGMIFSATNRIGVGVKVLNVEAWDSMEETVTWEAMGGLDSLE